MFERAIEPVSERVAPQNISETRMPQERVGFVHGCQGPHGFGIGIEHASAIHAERGNMRPSTVRSDHDETQRGAGRTVGSGRRVQQQETPQSVGCCPAQ
jgi:hypothetical protein